MRIRDVGDELEGVGEGADDEAVVAVRMLAVSIACKNQVKKSYIDKSFLRQRIAHGLSMMRNGSLVSLGDFCQAVTRAAVILTK